MLKTSDGLEVDIVSSNFQVISHQSQLPSTNISQDKKKAKKRKGQKRSQDAEVRTVPPVFLSPGIIDFGLLSDAAIKAESVKVESHGSDLKKSRRFLLEQADDLARRICTLQEEEIILRQQAAEVYESNNE